MLIEKHYIHHRTEGLLHVCLQGLNFLVLSLLSPTFPDLVLKRDILEIVNRVPEDGVAR